MATLESDEAFARRLQEQESGHGAIDPQTPLMVSIYPFLKLKNHKYLFHYRLDTQIVEIRR